MYYTAQYQRVDQHETHRLQLSSYVMAGTVAALAILAEGKGSPLEEIARVGLAAALVFVNVFAILYTFRAAYWTNIHLTRVTETLRALSEELAAIQDAADQHCGRDPSERHSKRAHYYQSAIHFLLAAASLAVVVGS